MYINYQEKQEALGDEVGMFPKEESHVRVIILFYFYLTDICIKINFLGKAQIIRRPKILVGPNFRHHVKISSLKADIVWADKVYSNVILRS